MKLKSCLFVFAILFFCSFVFAENIPSPKDAFVNDFANILSAPEISFLQSLFYEVRTNTTAEIVFVSVSDCGADYDGYAINLATSWGIGKSDKDNGLLMLYCVSQKRFVIKTGYGLEGILPDGKIGRMLDENYVPLRDANKTSEGILKFSQEISNVIEENKEEIISGIGEKNSETNFIEILFFIFIFYLIVSKIIGAIFKNKKKVPWFIPLFIPIPSRGSGSGFGGGSFGGGFSGGGFGGGGASR